MIRCLVIDDSSFDRKVVRQAAEHCGLQLKLWEVSDIQSANRVLDVERFDCVLLDFLLPDGDGLSFAERFLATENPTPIIMLTGQGSEQIVREAFQLGILDYLAKESLTSQSLEHVIVNVLAKNRLLRIQQDLLGETIEDALKIFAGHIICNLKSPIGDIKSLCHSLSEKYHNALDEDGKRSLNSVALAADRASNLIDSLLAYLHPPNVGQRHDHHEL